MEKEKKTIKAFELHLNYYFFTLTLEENKSKQLIGGSKIKNKKIFKQLETRSPSVVLLSISCGAEFIIFKSQTPCFEVRLTGLDKSKKAKQSIDKSSESNRIYTPAVCATEEKVYFKTIRALTPEKGGKNTKPLTSKNTNGTLCDLLSTKDDDTKEYLSQ